MLQRTLLAFLLLVSSNNHAQTKRVKDTSYTIAVASFGPLNTDLFIADANGNNPKPLLPHPEHDYNASFSNKGDWIVFTSERNGSADIYRVRPDGSHLQALVSHPSFDDQAALSPDGRFLAFVSSRSGQVDIWILELATKKLRNLTQDPGGDFRPSWSPDGTWIAFTSDRHSTKPKQNFTTLHSTELFIVHPDGTGLQRLTHDNAFAGSPAWSVDSKKLVYYKGSIDDVRKITSPLKRRGTCQIVSIDLQTKTATPITEGEGEKWSPKFISHDKMAYTSGGPQGGIEFTSGAAGARGEFKCPSWSADGKQVVFHREVSHNWPPVKTVYSLNQNFNLVRTGIFPSFSPSGDTLICNDQTAGILRNSILMMNKDGSQSSIVLSDTGMSLLAPAWSPLGDKIAFSMGSFFQQVHKQSSIGNLALIDPGGRNLSILTDSSGNYAFPSWSPDGKQLVFKATGENKNGLYIIDVATRKITLLIDKYKNCNMPSWSPNGDRIAFGSNENGHYEIYTIKPDGTDIRQLTFQKSTVAHSVWSPDGKWIAFVSIIGGFKDEALLHPYSTEPSSDLYIMREDGSDVRRLTDNQHLEGTPVWLPKN